MAEFESDDVEVSLDTDKSWKLGRCITLSHDNSRDRYTWMITVESEDNHLRFDLSSHDAESIVKRLNPDDGSKCQICGREFEIDEQDGQLVKYCPDVKCESNSKSKKIEFESADVEVSLDTDWGDMVISNKHTEGIESIHLTDPDAIRLIMEGLRFEKNALESKLCVMCSHPSHAYQCMADDEDGIGQCDCGASKYRKHEPEDFKIEN